MIGLFKKKLRSLQSFLLKNYQHALYGSCRVLLYHRVTDLDADPQLLAVSPANFDAHLEHLSNAYNVLKIEQFEKILRNKMRFPKNAILITFDDGYADNYLEALPTLEKHDLQALFYVSTGNLNTTNEYWWDAVERIVLCSGQSPSKNELEINGHVFALNVTDEPEKIKLYEALLPLLRRMPAEPRDEIIAELAEIFGSKEPRASHRAMTWEELSAMDSSKSAVIGAHTHLHPSLGALGADEQLAEIRQSKEILEETLGREVTHFSYPFGTDRDYNEDTLKIVGDLGFEFVAANYPAVVNKRSDRLRFPRYLVRDWVIDEFSKQLKSFA